MAASIDGLRFPDKLSVAEELIAPENNWGANGYRWFDYSASTSLMIIVIYVLFGVFDAISCVLPVNLLPFLWFRDTPQCVCSAPALEGLV